MESAVRTLDGVTAADADYRRGIVVVEYEPEKVTPEQIMGAINTQTYYRATGIVEGGEPDGGAAEGGAQAGETATAVIRVEGMTNELVASQVMAAMGTVGGIIDVSTDLEASTLKVEYDPAAAGAESLVRAIEEGSPYTATLLSATEGEEEVGAAARTFDYAKYAVWGIVGLFVAALAWSALNWGRRRWAAAGPSPSRAARRRQRRRERGRSPR